jgi:antitoxin component YwqK of YwqJK toxin-antitoxin module
MWKALALWAFLAVVPGSASAWEKTTIDTAETRYANGQLHEQYQQLWWGGNESTWNDGFYRSWHENGQLEWDGQYTHGEKTETWVHWDSTGSRTEEVSYSAGIKHGSEISWNPNGALRTSLCYRQGKLHGLCVWYVDNNVIDYNNPCLSISAERLYVDGAMLLPINDTTGRPCMDGLVGGKEPYHNVESDVWIEWDRGNSHFFVGRQVEGKKHGVWIQWSADGDMERVDVYDNGRLLTF